MINCKYRTPCGICTIRTDADDNPFVVHYCKYDEKCTVTYPKADSHKKYWDNVGREELEGEEE